MFGGPAPSRKGWCAEAAEIWTRHPGHSATRVAQIILDRLARERLAGNERWVPTDRTIRETIKKLGPAGQARRRSGGRH